MGLNLQSTPDFIIGEQRIWPRIQTSLYALHADDQGFFHEDPVKNLSKGGLFLNSKTAKKKGERLELILMLPDQSAEVTVQGQVMYCEPINEKNQLPHYGLGIMFTAIEPNLKRYLSHFIDRLLITEGGGKRIAPRIQNPPCEIQISDADGEVSAALCNISQRGMFIRTKDSLSLMDRVKTSIQHPETRLKIEVEAEVIHMHKTTKNELPYGVGLRFLNLEPQTESALLELVREIMLRQQIRNHTQN